MQAEAASRSDTTTTIAVATWMMVPRPRMRTSGRRCSVHACAHLDDGTPSTCTPVVVCCCCLLLLPCLSTAVTRRGQRGSGRRCCCCWNCMSDVLVQVHEKEALGNTQITHICLTLQLSATFGNSLPTNRRFRW